METIVHQTPYPLAVRDEATALASRIHKTRHQATLARRYDDPDGARAFDAAADGMETRLARLVADAKGRSIIPPIPHPVIVLAERHGRIGRARS